MMERKNEMERHMWDRTWQNVRNVLYIPLLIIAVLVVSLPVRAQTGIVTPTPYPAISATRTAAQAQLDAANAQAQQAAQMDAQAEQMKRNAEIQQDEAQRAIDDARAASAAQNAAAVGEAIGRAESNLAQLRDTNAGQAALLKEGSAIISSQAATIISLTNRITALEVDKQVIQQNYAAMSDKAQQAERDGASAPIVPLVIGAGVILAFAVVLVVIVQRKQVQAYHDDGTVMPPLINIEYDDYDVVRDTEAIDNEIA